MRLVCSVIAVLSLVLGPRSSRADDGPVVVADCKTQIRSSMVGGLGIRLVAGGYTPGMQAYVHVLPSTNGKPKGAGLVGALNVKLGQKPMNNTVAMVVVNNDGASKFELTISKQKTIGGQNTATLLESEVNGTKLETQGLVCRLAGPTAVAGCDDSPKPAVCPGDGGASCVNRAWVCAPAPRGCDASQRPVGCPGGRAATCSDSQWQCPPLPQGK